MITISRFAGELDLIKEGEAENYKILKQVSEAPDGAILGRISTLRRLITDDRFFVKVLYYGAAQAGYIVAGPNNHNQGEIISVYIRPEFRRRGCAKFGVIDAIIFLNAQGVDDIVLDVGVNNSVAKKLYTSLSFKEESIKMVFQCS